MCKYDKLCCIVRLLAVVIGLTPITAAALCTNYSTSLPVGRLNDTLVNEASGLVASRQYPGVFWVHNDSGDSARLFAFYIRCGTAYSLGYFTVDGISAGNTVDWEDISIGPGPDGRQWIYVGDFGNNGGWRNNASVGFLRLVRFPEPPVTIPEVDPAIPPGNRGSTEAGRTEILPFKFPHQAAVPTTGEYDQESLAVHPYSGRAYLITKRIGNTQTAIQHAYAFNLDDPLWISTLAVNWSSPIKTDALRLTNPSGIYGQITAMDISPDGLRTVVRESTVGWVYTSTVATRDAFEQSWTTTPDRFTADIAQDEAIAFSHDGEYIYHLPEGVSPQVHRVNCAEAPFIQDVSGALTASDEYTLIFNTKNSDGTPVNSTARINWGSSFPPTQVVDLSTAASSHAAVLQGVQTSQTYLYQISTQRLDSSGNLLTDLRECSFEVAEQVGSLNVAIVPQSAIDAGAQWRVDGGPWKSSGDTVAGLPIGQHTVSFNDVAGWAKPGDKTSTISADQTTTTTGIYTKPATVWYVDDKIPDSGDGKSWAGALKTLQQAIDAAQAGDEIWVKASIYMLATPITISKAVSMCGGFDGSETQRDQRNWHVHTTTLHGQTSNACLIVSGSAIVDGFVITRCHGNLGGGALDSQGTITFANNEFVNNSADLGGAVYNLGGTVTFENCAFFGNSATTSGGAMYNDGATVTIKNCTFSGNSATNSAGAIANDAASTLTVVNSILWDDKAGDTVSEIINSGGTIDVSYSDVEGGYPGSGNLDVDPQFILAVGGILSLKPTSPCIDRGENTGISEYDLDLNPRLMDGDGGGAVVDMGAYEFNPVVQELPTVAIITVDSIASESGESGQFFIYRTGAAEESLTVSYAVAGAATNGGDYALLPGILTIPAYSWSAPITVAPKEDSLYEGDETVTLALIENPSSYVVGLPNSAEVVIVDNEPKPPTVTIMATDPYASERGNNTGRFTIYRTGDASESLFVRYSVGGTARNRSDYYGLSGLATIPAGHSSASIIVRPRYDRQREGVESVEVILLNDLSYLIGPANSAIVSIADLR